MDASGVALVTGASRGIGRGLALELFRRGFDVVATMRDPAVAGDLLTAAGEGPGTIEIARLDVTEPASIVVPDGTRVVINNAGIEVENLPVEETSSDEWRQVFETNVFGLVEVTRRAIPVLRAAGGGVIANITTGGLLVPMPFFGLYRASKAAVSALGETLRAEVAPFGIRIVEILPGPIDTEMLAASHQLPQGVRFEAYAALARRISRVRGDEVGGSATPVADAAKAIVDAVLDDGGPLRYGCDALGSALLESWRAASDEEHMAGFLDAFTVDPEAGAAP